MKTELNKKTSELEIIIAAKKEDWQKTQKDVQIELIKELSIKGFRKGKVPFNIGKKHISQSEIMQKSVHKMIDSLSKKAFKLIDNKTMILSGPRYWLTKMSDADLEVKFSYPVFPDFKIGDYKNLKTKFSPEKVNEKAINEELEIMRSNQTMLKDKIDNKINKGDVVIFDYEGFIDGKAFKGGKAYKYELEIGSGKFIPGFEEQMINMQKNDKKDIKVIFPGNYHDENLKSKTAVFKIFIHEVKFKEIPKLDDNFAKTAGILNVSTISELKKHLKDKLKENYKQNAQIKFQREAFDEILEKTKELVIPEILINKEIESLKNNMMEDLKKREINFKKYLKTIGSTEEKLNVQFKDQAYSRLKDAFIFAEIAKLEKIKIFENDYKEQYKKLANVYSQSIEDIKNIFSKEQIQIMLMNKKVIDILIKNVN